jgi:hypothetical protein
MCIEINKVGKQEAEIWLVQKLTIWGTYMNLVAKYQISAINSCWEKGEGKCAYMFNVYKNQLSRQTGSRNLTGPKTLPAIWYAYMTLVTKYQISAINSYWEICNEKYLGRTDGTSDGTTDVRTERRTDGRNDGRTDGRADRQTEVKQYTPFRGAGV